MTTKNPFEIRTEILTMAKEYMDRQYEISFQFAHHAFIESVNAGKVAVDAWSQYVPKMYTIKELMEKAQELYGFVNTK